VGEDEDEDEDEDGDEDGRVGVRFTPAGWSL
jgi:hypothetical protein